MKNATLIILLFLFGYMLSFATGYSVGYVAHKVAAPSINCPFPQSWDQMQTPTSDTPFDPTGTGEGPKG